jgi:GrpB-like predicted nucleotidyltransferase (UPF0157 family)
MFGRIKSSHRELQCSLPAKAAAWCLRFRDSLRGNPELAGAYATLKRALAARFGEDREGYTEGKSTFVKSADY